MNISNLELLFTSCSCIFKLQMNKSNIDLCVLDGHDSEGDM